MTIIRVAQGESSILASAPFQHENELVDALALHPSMFLAEGRHEIELVTRQLRLPDTGTVDLALVDRDGQPVLVEVKLARFPETRREVIAQIFDNVAALSAWTADDLDQASNGQLGHAVRSLVSDDQERAVRWRSITQNLQAGRIRIVFAVDEVTPAIEQVLKFVGAHSDIEVQVLVVDRLADAQGNGVFHTEIRATGATSPKRAASRTRQPAAPRPATKPVASKSVKPAAPTPAPTSPTPAPASAAPTASKASPAASATPSATASRAAPTPTAPTATAAPTPTAPPAVAPQLQTVLDVLHARLPENITVQAQGPSSCSLRPAGWPAGVMYEINHGKYQTVELHLSDASLSFLAPTLKEMAKSLASFFEKATCTFDPDFGPERGIIRLMHSPGAGPNVVAKNLMTLIESTRGPITRLIKAGQAKQAETA